MSGEFLTVAIEVCAILTIAYISHCMFDSVIDYFCRPRDLTPEEINQIEIDVKRQCREREARIRKEVDEELHQLFKS